MEIGERIKLRREELGLSQMDLAIKVGYTSKTTIAKIEANANQLRQSKIQAFADALNVTPGYLLGWEEPQPVPTFEKEHIELILLYSKLTDKQKENILDTMRSFAAVNQLQK